MLHHLYVFPFFIPENMQYVIPDHFTPEQKRRARFLLKKRELLARKIEKEKALCREVDPFYTYEPSDGSITQEGLDIIGEFIEPEDIPPVFHGQKHIHLSKAEIVGGSGGNRGGKSTAFSVEDFIGCTGDVPIAMQGWYPKEKLPDRFPVYARVIGVDEKQVDNVVIPIDKKWVPRRFLKNGNWEDSFEAKNKRLVLSNPNNRKKAVAYMEYRTNEQAPKSHQGIDLDRLRIDEECGQAIFDENIARFGTAKRLRISVGWTPTEGLTWMGDMFGFGEIPEDLKGSSIDYFQLASVTNPMINCEIVRSTLLKYKRAGQYEEIKMRLLGAFVSLSGLVYGRLFDRSVHVIDPFKISNGDHMIVRGLDPHLVKPTTCVESAIDRNNIEYVIGLYQKDADTQEVKDDLAERARKRDYRLGWSICDKSANSTIKIFGDRNIYLELSRGRNAIPALFLSDKFTGSINAGVDDIKQRLALNEKTRKPTLFIFDAEENQPLIKAFRMLERDTYKNEEDKGKKDRIKEGPHDAHAALRYIHQRTIRWLPPVEIVPDYEPDNEMVAY